VDPDSEVICAAEVSVATTGDAVVAPSLLDDLTPANQSGGQVTQALVYGDSAYGTGAHLAWLEHHGVTSMVKAQLPTAPGGRFAKDQFRLDLQRAPGPARPGSPSRSAQPAVVGAGPVRRRLQRLPAAPGLHHQRPWSSGRDPPQEADLAAARARQRDPAWLANYRATRPKVERKLAHLLRRRHGGRRARVRGLVRVGQDFKLLAAAVNLARYATLGLYSTNSGWQVQPA
jgi:Transposase DDE domain